MVSPTELGMMQTFPGSSELIPWAKEGQQRGSMGKSRELSPVGLVLPVDGSKTSVCVAFRILTPLLAGPQRVWAI